MILKNQPELQWNGLDYNIFRLKRPSQIPQLNPIANLCEDFKKLMFTDELHTMQLSITSLGQKGNWAETVMYKAVRDKLMFLFVFIL